MKEYIGSTLTAPNANFEELSVFKNRNKLENLKEIKILELGPYTIPGPGGVKVDYGITFREILAVIPLTVWESQEQSVNPIAMSITTSSCLLDYVNGTITGTVKVYIIGYV